MVTEFLRWNIFNVFVFALMFDAYEVWISYKNASLQTIHGQEAIVSLVITWFALFAAYFNLSWLLTMYSIYLTIGLVYWCYQRFYFYKREVNMYEVDKLIKDHDWPGQIQTNINSNNGHQLNNEYNNQLAAGSSNTLQRHDKLPPVPTSLPTTYSSLQRQRVSSYKQHLKLEKPRKNHKQYLLSLGHLSNITAKLAKADSFYELHIQALASKRDVYNVVLRSSLLAFCFVLINFK